MILRLSSWYGDCDNLYSDNLYSDNEGSERKVLEELLKETRINADVRVSSQLMCLTHTCMSVSIHRPMTWSRGTQVFADPSTRPAKL